MLLGLAVEAAMIGISLFMLYYGLRLVQTTWHQVIADFPIISTGVAYLPVPIGGAVVGLFVIERIWCGTFFEAPDSQTITTALEGVLPAAAGRS